MQVIPAVELLKKAQAVLSDESKFVKDFFACAERGVPVDPHSPLAVKWDGMGALMKVADGAKPKYYRGSAMMFLRNAARAMDYAGPTEASQFGGYTVTVKMLQLAVEMADGQAQNKS